MSSMSGITIVISLDCVLIGDMVRFKRQLRLIVVVLGGACTAKPAPYIYFIYFPTATVNLYILT